LDSWAGWAKWECRILAGLWQLAKQQGVTWQESHLAPNRQTAAAAGRIGLGMVHGIGRRQLGGADLGAVEKDRHGFAAVFVVVAFVIYGALAVALSYSIAWEDDDQALHSRARPAPTGA
jgi:hypothetical protein